MAEKKMIPRSGNFLVDMYDDMLDEEARQPECEDNEE